MAATTLIQAHHEQAVSDALSIFSAAMKLENGSCSNRGKKVIMASNLTSVMGYKYIDANVGAGLSFVWP